MSSLPHLKLPDGLQLRPSTTCAPRSVSHVHPSPAMANTTLTHNSRSTGSKVSTQSVASKPAAVQPRIAQPAAVQPRIAQPAAVQPTTGQPAAVQLTRGQRTIVQPTIKQPAAVQPTKPATVQPTTKQPTAVQPTTQPVAVQPITQPVTVQPTTQPVAAQPTTQPVAVKPTTQPVAVRPATQPVTVQPTTQPVAVQPTTQPVAVQPATQPVEVQPTTQPVTVQPTTQPVTVQPTTQPVTVQPTTQPVAARPTTQPAGVQPSAKLQPAVIQPTARQLTAVQPTAPQVGSYPLATQVGSYPLATQVGSYPLATQVGSYPLATQVGSYPLATHPTGTQLPWKKSIRRESEPVTKKRRLLEATEAAVGHEMTKTGSKQGDAEDILARVCSAVGIDSDLVESVVDDPPPHNHQSELVGNTHSFPGNLQYLRGVRPLHPGIPSSAHRLRRPEFRFHSSMHPAYRISPDGSYALAEVRHPYQQYHHRPREPAYMVPHRIAIRPGEPHHYRPFPHYLNRYQYVGPLPQIMNRPPMLRPGPPIGPSDRHLPAPHSSPNLPQPSDLCHYPPRTLHQSPPGPPALQPDPRRGPSDVHHVPHTVLDRKHIHPRHSDSEVPYGMPTPHHSSSSMTSSVSERPAATATSRSFTSSQAPLQPSLQDSTGQQKQRAGMHEMYIPSTSVNPHHAQGPPYPIITHPGRGQYHSLYPQVSESYSKHLYTSRAQPVRDTVWRENVPSRAPIMSSRTSPDNRPRTSVQVRPSYVPEQLQRYDQTWGVKRPSNNSDRPPEAVQVRRTMEPPKPCVELIPIGPPRDTRERKSVGEDSHISVSVVQKQTAPATDSHQQRVNTNSSQHTQLPDHKALIAAYGQPAHVQAPAAYIAQTASLQHNHQDRISISSTANPEVPSPTSQRSALRRPLSSDPSFDRNFSHVYSREEAHNSEAPKGQRYNRSNSEPSTTHCRTYNDKSKNSVRKTDSHCSTHESFPPINDAKKQTTISRTSSEGAEPQMEIHYRKISQGQISTLDTYEGHRFTPDNEIQISTLDKEIQISTLDKEIQISTPDKEIQISTPDKEIQISTPDKEIQISTPDKEIQISTPDNEIQISTLDKERQIPTPDKEIQISTPDKERQIPTPDKEIQISTPDKEIQISTPDKEIQISTPDKEIQIPTPDKERQIPTPDKEIQISTPDKERQIPTPDKERQIPTPDKERQISTPDKEIQISTPENDVTVEKIVYFTNRDRDLQDNVQHKTRHHDLHHNVQHKTRCHESHHAADQEKLERETRGLGSGQIHRLHSSRYVTHHRSASEPPLGLLSVTNDTVSPNKRPASLPSAGQQGLFNPVTMKCQNDLNVTFQQDQGSPFSENPSEVDSDEVFMERLKLVLNDLLSVPEATKLQQLSCSPGQQLASVVQRGGAHPSKDLSPRKRLREDFKTVVNLCLPADLLKDWGWDSCTPDQILAQLIKVTHNGDDSVNGSVIATPSSFLTRDDSVSSSVIATLSSPLTRDDSLEDDVFSPSPCSAPSPRIPGPYIHTTHVPEPPHDLVSQGPYIRAVKPYADTSTTYTMHHHVPVSYVPTACAIPPHVPRNVPACSTSLHSHVLVSHPSDPHSTQVCKTGQEEHASTNQGKNSYPPPPDHAQHTAVIWPGSNSVEGSSECTPVNAKLPAT